MNTCETFIFTQQFLPQIGDAEKKNMAGAEISNGLKLVEGSRRSQNKVQFIVKPAGIISNVRPLVNWLVQVLAGSLVGWVQGVEGNHQLQKIFQARCSKPQV